MTDLSLYQRLYENALEGKDIGDECCRQILSSDGTDLFSLLHAAYVVRKRYWGKTVTVHIIDNVQNGLCSQDCRYCAQSRDSQAPITPYPFKSDEEILAEARQACEAGAFRHCLVFSGYGPSQKRIEHLAGLVREMKSRHPSMQVCVSPGVITEQQAAVLKAAGLDRLNHNLNTSERHYPQICSTHSYLDRVNTIKAARKAGLEVCSGMIVGMGEGPEDIMSVARTLREVRAASIPVNFFLPIEGTGLKDMPKLTPEFCLRVLCLFRFINPEAEIRMAAGREVYLRDVEVLGLYPANSLFLDGYLNVKGSNCTRTLKLIRDAGFTIRSERNLDELIEKECAAAGPDSAEAGTDMLDIKAISELRPNLAPGATKG